MNNSKKTGLLAIMILWCFGSMAQNFRYPVVARITQNAPYPIYLQDYANPSQTNFSIQLEVRDNSLPLRRVRLRLYISGPTGLIQSTPMVRDEKVIELGAGQFYDLPSPDVANYFQPYNLLISPAQYSENLVDGSYQFGVEVFDDLTNRPLSSVQYAAPVWLVVNDPPVLIIPDNESVVKVETPQFLNFQWMPRHRNVTDVNYEFSLTELNVPLDYAGNIQNLFLAQPPIYTENTTQTQLNYDYSKPPLTPGKIYAYRVRAIAKNGLEEIGMFRNNGYSEIRWFRYLEPLLPPYDESVNRLKENDNLEFQWRGYDNHLKYFLRYRNKSAEWQQKEFSSLESVQGLGENYYIMADVPEGSYEYQIGAGGNVFQPIAWGALKTFKDVLPRPVTNTPYWKDSELATISWYGDRRFEGYQLTYKKTNAEDWEIYENAGSNILTVDEVNQIFNLEIAGLDSTSSYHFKIVGVDIDKDTAASTPAYLKYWITETELRTEEKEVTGTLSWSFLEKEVSLGAISGSVQEEVASFSENLNFIHSDTQTAGSKYPLTNVNVEVFADSACTVLLRSSAVNEYGGFSVRFPSEALRGGLLPSVLILRVKHPVFGEFKKAIYPKIFDTSLDVGDWIVPAKTFRFTPLITDVSPDLFFPDEHLIKVYRRAAALSTDPYLKYEGFGRANSSTFEKINNEDYFKIADLRPGQTLAGMFYARESHHPANEFLIQMEGPLPFEKRYLKKEVAQKGGVYELQVGIDQIIGQPHIFGDIIFDKSIAGGQSLKIELASSSGHSETISAVSNYRFNLPLSELNQTETYTLRVYLNNQFKLQETFNLNRESLGTRRDLHIGDDKYITVLSQILDEEKRPVSYPIVSIDGLYFKGDKQGIIAFWALENAEVEINLSMTSYEMSSQKFFVQSQTESESPYNNLKELKGAMITDLNALKGRHPELEKVPPTVIYTLLGKVQNPLHNSDNQYAGSAFYKLETDARPKPFVLNFLVKNAFNEPISNVAIVENGLDNLGKTNQSGDLSFTSHKGRGTVTYKLIPSAASGYPEKEIAFDYPALNSSTGASTVVIQLDNRSYVEGNVLEMGTGEPIAGARVKIEYLTSVMYAISDANGHYKAFMNPFTEEENFIILTGTKDSHFDKVVHVAASSKYSRNYQRDIYMRPRPVIDTDDEAFKYLRLFGFSVEISKRYNATSAGDRLLFDMDGLVFDQEGNSYEFSVNQAYIIQRDIVPSVASVPLKLKSGKSLYLKKLPVSKSEPIYLSSISGSLKDGLIYTEKLSFDLPALSPDLYHVYASTDLDDPDKFKIKLNNSIHRINFKETPFPLAHSGGEEPILSIEFFPDGGTGTDLVQELKNYYQSDNNDLSMVNKLFSNKDGTQGLYGFKNFVFGSMLVKPSGIELNNLVVMPLMSLSNVHISLLNIDKLRLAEDKIDEVLIDYSKSPRKLSMGADVVKAQIEEVYANSDGIDITYFTNNGGNIIKPNTPSITEIRYNSNGIFYSDFRNQKQIVQTAAVLNPVYMYQFPKPAMGPGYRINVTSTSDIADQALDFLLDSTGTTTTLSSSTSPSSASSPGSSSGISSATPASAFPRLILEGYSSIELQPHIFKMKWKFENETQKWKNELEDFESTDFWGYTVLRPISVKGAKLDIDLTENADTGENDADMNSGTLAVKYGVTVPIVGSLTIDTKAKWDEGTEQFYRENIQAKVSTKIASILAFEAKFILLLDEIEGKIDGLFCKVAGKLELAKFADKLSFEGSGGYVNVDDDPIFGFSVGVGNDVTQQKYKGFGTFKLMNGRLSFLYDGPNSAVFMQMSADMGFGKKHMLSSSDLRQFSPEPSDWAERDRQSRRNEAITKRWKTAKDNFKKEGVVDAKLVVFNEMFMMGEGNSGFSVDDHKVTIKKAEMGLAVSLTEGATLTGSGILFIEGQQLLEAAFLMSFVKADADSANWRVFVGIPSFNKNVAGPFTDLSANLQIDMGESDGMGNFLLMGGVEADWPVHPIVYLKLGAKFVLGINAVASSSELQSTTRAGGQTLSKTASNIVKFMGSNFNSIAEKSIQQRVSFFNAIDQEAFLDSNGRFSGIYVGLKAAVMLGLNKSFESDLVAGSARFGIGVELGAGWLKSFTDYAMEVRFKVGLVAEVNVRASAPVEADLINININLPTFCGAGFSNDSLYKDWKWRFLVSFIEFDDVIGYTEASNVDCNSAGFFYVRPCLYFYFYSNPDYEKYANGLFEVSSEPNNFRSNTCPIEW